MLSASARENVSCLIAFLTTTITIAIGINPGAPGLNILEWFQKSEMLKWFVLKLLLNKLFIEQF